jgi:hypothetical protein
MHPREQEHPMRTGTYRDQTGQLATVHTTATGYLVRYADGRVVSISTTATRCIRSDSP